MPIHRAAVMALLAGAWLTLSAPSIAQVPPAPVDMSAWCAPEIEALGPEMCHIDGGQQGPRRSLVIFLHGFAAPGRGGQWLQQRILLKQARQNGFEAIFPRAPLGPDAYLWPALVVKQEAIEGAYIQSWHAAIAQLEKKAGRPYDDVFLMGFSSGAYFASSLALRGRLDFVGGYAVLAGGAAYPPRPAEPPRPLPVFVGICGEDDVSARNARGFKDALLARGLPYRVDEEPVGHILSDAHVANALAYLRSAAKRN